MRFRAVALVKKPSVADKIKISMAYLEINLSDRQEGMTEYSLRLLVTSKNSLMSSRLWSSVKVKKQCG